MRAFGPLLFFSGIFLPANFKHLYSIVLLSGVACAAAGCASAPAEPQLFLWQSRSIEADASNPPASQSGASLFSEPVEGGWGLYSGARGQTVPPQSETYVYRGAGTANAEVARAQMN